jgi:tellurite resistance protein
MAILFAVGLLLAVGMALAYRLSAGVAACKKAEASLKQFCDLRDELISQANEIKSGVSQAAERVRQDVRTERLRALSVDEIKQHASGVRLQALKDAGLTRLLDLQGWGADRLSNLRGVGPKSAGTIAAVAQSLISSSNARPIPIPSPPFHIATERALVRALYTQLYFESHHAAERRALTDLVERSEEKLADIARGTTLASWSMSFFGSKRGRLACDHSGALVHELQADASAPELQRCIEKHLIDLRDVRMQTVAQNELLAAYESDSRLYDWLLYETLQQRPSSPRPVSRQADTVMISASSTNFGLTSRTDRPDAADAPVAGATDSVVTPPPTEQVQHMKANQMNAAPAPHSTLSLAGGPPRDNQTVQPFETTYALQSVPHVSELASPLAKEKVFMALLSLLEAPAQQLIAMIPAGSCVASVTNQDVEKKTFAGTGVASTVEDSSLVTQAAEQNIANPYLEGSTEPVLSSQVGTPKPAHSGETDETVVHVEFGPLVAGPAPIPPLPTDVPVPMPLTITRTAEEALRRLEKVRAAREVERRAGEELISLQIGQPVVRSGVSLPAPLPLATTQRHRLRWVTASETVLVQGITISGSYYFCGTAKANSEPYVINPALSIAGVAQQGVWETSLSHSYVLFAPHMRRRYLEWLSGGAKERNVPEGFGKLYYQNLERRLLEWLRGSIAPSQEEIEEILAEVRRVDSLFVLTSNSITYQAKRLLQLFDARTFVGAAMPDLPTRVEKTDQLPFRLRLGLGCFLKEKRPIPAAWALSWAYAEPTIYLRTAPVRCNDEFEAAFRHLYEKRYGQGLVIESNQTMLKADYLPLSSGGDDSRVELTFNDVPDVAALSAPRDVLTRLVADATELIDSYSRYLGPTGKGAGTLEALLRLPDFLWKPECTARLDAFHSQFVEPMVPLTLDALFNAFGVLEGSGSTNITELSKHLRTFKIGLETHALHGAHKPKLPDYVITFPLPAAGVELAETESSRAATLAISLAAVLANADGHASDEESAAADELVQHWPDLTLEDRARLRAVYRLILRQSPALTGFKSRLAALGTDHRKRVASALTTVAASDGVVSADEVNLLERVYRMLELEPQALYSDLHGAGGFHEPKAASSRTATMFLDPARLKHLRAQSSEIGELLAGVFVEEDSQSTPTPVIVSTSSAESQVKGINFEPQMLSGLSAKDGRFLVLLVTKPMWSRQQLIEAAANFQIMLDGTLERINESALDQLGEFLIEGDDPLYVQQTLLETAE